MVPVDGPSKSVSCLIYDSCLNLPSPQLRPGASNVPQLNYSDTTQDDVQSGQNRLQEFFLGHRQEQRKYYTLLS